MDLKEILANAISTGKVTMGQRSVLKSLMLENPKFVMLSSNCPEKIKSRIIYYCKIAQIKFNVAKVDSITLGSYCGKPFPVSVLSIINQGDSRILEVKDWDQLN